MGNDFGQCKVIALGRIEQTFNEELLTLERVALESLYCFTIKYLIFIFNAKKIEIPLTATDSFGKKCLNPNKSSFLKSSELPQPELPLNNESWTPKGK